MVNCMLGIFYQFSKKIPKKNKLKKKREKLANYVTDELEYVQLMKEASKLI